MGVKVVCIKSHWQVVNGGPSLEDDPVCGAIYTLSGVFLEEGETLVSLRELPETDFYLEGFRPLITQQDDIETHFKALLDVPEQVGA